MGRRKKGDKINGWVNLDKPLGLTSTQALSRVRRMLNAQKAGHAGTLDPLATGVLPIALGEATKTIAFMQNAIKTYSFTVQWGAATNTDDREGDITETSDIRPKESDIRALLPDFVGTIQQTPPQFSAIKINGERAYDLARSGQDVTIKSREVTIEKLDLLSASDNSAQFQVTCGKGTYVRSLARDMGQRLGCFGHIVTLRRERVGCFTTQDTISLDLSGEIDNSSDLVNALLPLDVALDDIPALSLKETEVTKLRNGQKLTLLSKTDYARLEQCGLGQHHNVEQALGVFQDQPVAILDVRGPDLQPVRVFNM